MPPYRVEDFAKLTNSEFRALERDADAEAVLREAFEIARSGRPVMVDVAIDYSKKTFFTKGAITTNFWRLPWSDRVRLLGRAVGRRMGAG